MMLLRGSVFILLVVCCVEARMGYILTVPKIFLSKAKENVCLNFHDVTADVNVHIKLTNINHNDTYLSQTFTYIRGVGRCVELDVPDVSDDYAIFSVFGEAPRLSYFFNSSQKIGISHNNQATFIQTDKPVYKPGQTVRIRIATLTYDLKPLLDPIDLVHIESPGGIRMMQWKAIHTLTGLASLEMNLSKEPVLGTWKVVAEIGEKKHVKEFQVNEYVLPVFEVIIKPPAFIMADDQEINGEICARYTYGKPVKGVLKLSFCITHAYYGSSGRCHVETKMIQGCDGFRVRSETIGLSSPHSSDPLNRLNITAEVIEDGTGASVKATHDTRKIETQRLILDIDSPHYFKPGLAYHGRVMVRNPDSTPAARQRIRLELLEPKIHNTIYERNYTSDKNGLITFDLPSMITQLTSVTIKVESLQYTSRHGNTYMRAPSRSRKEVKAWYSPTGRYLQIKPVYETAKPGDLLFVNITFTSTPKTSVKFFYEVMTLGNIVLSGSKKQRFTHSHPQSSHPLPALTPTTAPPPLPYVSQYVLKLPVEAKMSPRAHLLVYYVTDNGEVVADSTDFEGEQSLQNQVKVKFSNRQILPGGTTYMKLNADPGSVCALGVVDKSVHILGGDALLKLSQVFTHLKQHELEPEKTEPFQTEPYCWQKLRGNGGQQDFKDFLFSGHLAYYSNYFDSTHAFKNMGLSVASDLDLDTRPCISHPRRGMRPYIPPPVDEKRVELRENFPETWLWEIHFIGGSGEVQLPRTLPHTITEWVGNAFCTNWRSGLGVSPTATIRTYQPFFVSFTPPYSVIRGERAHLTVSVFNYLPTCSAIKLEILHNSQYEVEGGRVLHLCVCGRESKTHIYKVLFKKLGQVNVTIQAEPVSDSRVCGNNQLNLQIRRTKDVVRRRVLVEPEGRERQYTFNDFICLEENTPKLQNVELTLPRDIVPESAKAEIQIIGDVMGPVMSDLDKLVNLPTGCGEQNMVKFAPNIYVLQYLTNTNQLSPELKKKALGYMQRGYQQELKYRHRDGSYSAFGNRDPDGSTYLTAFVVKCLAQAKPYIFIDQTNLDKSINWIKSIQQGNGCFPKIGWMLNRRMKGGVNSKNSSPATLTTYVLIALLEAGLHNTDSSVTKAFACLDRYNVSDSYTIAMMAYAYTLADANSDKRAQIMTKLESIAISENGTKHWSRQSLLPTAGRSSYTIAVSADVEMTSYALLAYVRSGQSSSVTSSQPIVKWLSKQRNVYGGFSSTQDTVVALQALAEFADLTYSEGVDVIVAVQGDVIQETFTVNDENKLLLQRLAIAVPNSLRVLTTGSGCVLFQASVRYNEFETSASVSSDFDLQLSVSGSNCNALYMKICTRYTGQEGSSNMAVVSVKMISGWKPVHQSLAQLLTERKLGLKRFDFDLGTVNFYFEQLTKSKKCFQFQIERFLTVIGAKSAMAEVYDYYDRDFSASASYSMSNSCN